MIKWFHKLRSRALTPSAGRRMMLRGSCLLICYAAMQGCTGISPVYQETHVLERLTIVFLDQQSLEERYASLSGKPAVTFSALLSPDAIKTVHGFYDSNTKTIYCPKMNFEVCGHELHHAVVGPFHP